tara:strand:- start:120942 stop:122027 length:1086 start_codon:yes stop_codon:yes gene_type:complete
MMTNDHMDAVESIAIDYIRDVMTRVRDNFGVVIKTGMELEFYALNERGEAERLLDDDDIDAIDDELIAAGIANDFDDENDIDFYGQYEIAIGVHDPLTTAKKAMKARNYLETSAKRMGVSAFDFSALPFKDKEANAAHVSFSLWSPGGRPLFADKYNKPTALLKKVAQGVLDKQKHLFAFYSPNQEDYARYGNTKWTPKKIAYIKRVDKAGSLRFANCDDCYEPEDEEDVVPEDFRLEDRLASASSNYYIAMAAVMSGVEHGLTQYTTLFRSADDVPQSERDTYDLMPLDQSGAVLAVDKTNLKKFPKSAMPKTQAEAIKGLADYFNNLPDKEGREAKLCHGFLVGSNATQSSKIKGLVPR